MSRNGLKSAAQAQHIRYSAQVAEAASAAHEAYDAFKHGVVAKAPVSEGAP